MGQKTNPIGFRVGYHRNWDSRWFAPKRDYGEILREDITIRRFLMERLESAGIARVVIERPTGKVTVELYAARPGVIIGKKGGDIEKLQRALNKMSRNEVTINLVGIQKPEIDARLVADNIARQLEKRVSFRRALKRAIASASRLKAKGIRVNVGGRLGGAEIARMEWQREGQVPLHKLRANIDYGTATAFTTYGTCGVKVWIYKGDVRGSALEDESPAKEKSSYESSFSTEKQG